MKKILWLLLVLCGTVQACPQHFAGGRAPLMPKVFYQGGQLRCFSEFASFYSQPTRVPLWSAELLTPQRMRGAKLLSRQGEFYEDPALKDGARLADYRRSGFDRGHLAPSADMSTLAAQQESFNLSNIVPQNPTQNGNQWVGVESATRFLASKAPVYVITGVVFEGASVSYLQGRVGIPTALYKLLYVPDTKQAAAYWVGNSAEAKVEFLDVATLQARTGMNYGLGTVGRLYLPAPQMRRRNP